MCDATGEVLDSLAEVRSALSNRAVTPLHGGSAPAAGTTAHLLLTARMLQLRRPGAQAPRSAGERRALWMHQRDLGLRPSD